MSVPDPSTTDWVPIYAGAPTLDFVGDYVPATDYQDGDIVMFNGTPWLCVKSTNTPPEPFTMTVLGGSPTGGLMQFAGAVAPDGWLICDGASLLRANYAALFAVIGVIYGSEDATHFALPDLRGRIPVGLSPIAGTGVDALGLNEGEIIDNRSPKHKHSVNDPGHAHNVYDPGHSHYSVYPHAYSYDAGHYNGMGGEGIVQGNSDAAGTGIGIYNNPTGITVGAAWGAQDAPAFLAVNYIIKT